MNALNSSDRELLNSYLQGNKSAISTLIEKYNRRVRDYIRMMVGDADVAADIAQETFIKAVRVIDEGRYTDSGKFLSWIMRIAHNKALDFFRAQKNNNSVSESSSGYNILGTMRYSEKSIEDSMIYDQISADIRSLVDLLPEERRWPFFKELFRYRMDGTDPEPQTDLEQMALINIFPIVDASVERYEKNKENVERIKKYLEVNGAKE